MIRFMPVWAACLWVMLAVGVGAEDEPAPKPSEKGFSYAGKTIAILPVINASGEKSSAQRVIQAEKGKEALVRLFTERGFVPVDEVLVTKAMAELKVDLSDEEVQKRETFYRIARQVRADLVVFAVITDVLQRNVVNLFSTTIEGKSKVKLWLLDVGRELPILSAKTQEGKSGRNQWFGQGGSPRIVQAVANAMKDSLADFFKPYPLQKTAAETPKAK